MNVKKEGKRKKPREGEKDRRKERTKDSDYKPDK